MKQKIALIGFGTVAQGLCEILINKKNELAKKYNYRYEIVAVSDLRFGSVYNPDGLNLKRLLKEVKEKGKFIKDRVDWSAIETIEKSNSDVVCELAYTNLKDGQPAIKHCETAFKNKKHVVTSNKGPAALAYRRLKRLADKNGVKFMIEGTVLSGTPVLNLAEGPLAGNKIISAKGILNGTTNYILTKMEEGMSYEDALKEAQKLGYAEADPTNDVKGYDARAKITILANVLMNVNLNMAEVKCKGITKITLKEIAEAKKKNARWKLIGSVENKNGKIKAYVKPELIPLDHPLAGVMGSTNALTFTTDLLGDVTIVGKGAGKIETGFSILTDLLALNNSE
ncbi:homoserine dehydrogenase [Melioribacter roseus P3M-2]|uniref:Homoserine dehydrogenase n=2 Tax=Melioribacteraceae TaxID=1334117 RepID=I6Z2Y0_MELRP|nr:homoserine dehydrogenase [Melioribacter roseus]AFN73485.1 homoserine dehydrogenase [Melioribacter roseus P3M-2]